MAAIIVTLRNTTTAIAGLDYVRAADSGFGPGNTAANNTSIFNSLQTSMDPKKKLILPSGNIPIAGTLNYNPAIRLEGQGRNNTNLIPTMAVPMLVSNDDKLDFHAGGLRGIGFGSPDKNDGIATDGIVLGISAFSECEDIRVWGVTGTAFQAPGSLVERFGTLETRYGTRGVLLTSRPNSDFGTEGVINSLPNFIYFDHLSISDTTGRALEYNAGTGLHIKNFDLEGCGTLGGQSLVYIGNTGLGPIMLGLRLDSLYAERCKGAALFEFGPASSNSTGAIHYISFASAVGFTAGDVGSALMISSGNGKLNSVTLQAGNFSGLGPIQAAGATTQVVIHPDFILPDGRTQATDGATYIDLSGNSSGSGGAAVPGNLVGPAKVENNGPGAVMYTPNQYQWNIVNDANASGGTYSVNEQEGAYFGIGSWYGRYVTLYYLARPDMGDIIARVDGQDMLRFSGTNSGYVQMSKTIDMGSVGQHQYARFINVSFQSQFTVDYITVA